jgi:thymidylate synthase (FAD)
MHQDYSSDFVGDTRDQWPDESKCGEIIVNRLLKGDRGHYGCIEHPAITLGCKGFPHSVIQQARTHRVGISFDIQSFRYTSKGVIEVAQDLRDIEDVFYFRPVGHYKDRQGKSYEYNSHIRDRDKARCLQLARNYYAALTYDSLSEEHARDMLPFNYRQHFIVSFNLRSALHFMDLRSKKDAQLEIQQLCEQIWPHIQAWTPDVAKWYENTRMGKARLAP